jgi:two-component system, cell cycle sensor histidine kinase and response regulator CckA
VGFRVRLFDALLDSAPDAIALVDTSGRITLTNGRVEELFGFQPGQLVGREVEGLISGQLRPGQVDRQAGHACDPHAHELAAGLELCGRREDGSEFPVEISLSPIRVEAQDLLIAVVRDASDRQAAELEHIELARERAAHAETEIGRQRLASILGEVDAIVWEADAKRHRFNFVSKRAEDMLGYPVAAWLHEDDFWRGIVEPEDLALAELYFQEAIGRACDHDHEYRVRSVEGRAVWVRDRVRVALGGDGEPRLHGVTVDVTARRELEERLIQAQKMDAVGQLAGGVAHDFNNLIGVISGYTDLLLGRVQDDTSLIQLREISQAAGRAAELVAQLLAFGRRTPSLGELVDLGVLIRGIEPMLRRLIDQDVGLLIEVARDLPPVRADSGQLEQVLVNLLINARDAMPHGGEISVRATHLELDETQAAELALAAGQWVVLAVADDGSGMTSETKARIFEPFYTTKDPGKGTGLGLATVFGIVEQTSGRITVDTELGRGTTLSIYLRPATGSEDDVSEPCNPGNARVVLVVEDESAMRRLVRSVLEQDGYRVHEAANGRDALGYIEQKGGRIDLILSDVVMPGITGPELVARLAPLGHSTRVLFMSGYADSQLLSRGLDERSIGILHKPFTPAELSARVAQIMAEDEPDSPPV